MFARELMEGFIQAAMQTLVGLHVTGQTECTELHVAADRTF